MCDYLQELETHVKRIKCMLLQLPEELNDTEWAKPSIAAANHHTGLRDIMWKCSEL
jgi:hypothetical protein